MKKILFIYLLCLSGIAYSQQSQVYIQKQNSSNQDIFQKNLYSADKVMEMRNELDLTETQATKIKKIHSENAGKFSTMKWDLDDATLKLKAFLNESKIDEVAVQKQMDKVLALENAMKKQQLSTMVSIKNELSEEQQEILQGQHVQTVNGISITGYGKNSVSSSSTIQGYPIIKVGKPLGGANGVESTSNSSPKIILQASGTTPENAPLYMLDTKDGMKELKSLNSINPNDIDSINVLKDKAAITTFGEKGKNGVIIIKLKEDSKK
ncbi:TonB-dependent receptor-like protein [Algoriphagus ratkowskyi]|uniref:TonB-dependent receptor-like protein n=1 Tax=Algoriphagus ratkowskyi TaxID=57028 RepID=A0A2W7RFR9_9BACT|nr:Spy/CpxP family protein refolding chaperone [Algoriphagus ratkowskyi]PZX59743.1 TonB-dependent receptor-like protein [Algoriphagus ratkowskyi]TXD78543.1 hypothetical protein ESW18_07055 [Algoriphagus ratkowskyi]